MKKICITLLSFFATLSLFSQVAYYVNDNTITGNRFTTATGNDANNGTTALPFKTFEFALSVAQPGDTIYIDAGVYNLLNSEVLIDKELTILGPNYDIDPNDENDRFLPNALRNTEAKITEGEIVLKADGILISGLSFSGTGGGVLLRANDYEPVNNLTLSNNIFIVGETIEFGILLAGAGESEITTHDYLIQNNRFEDHGTNDQLWATGMEIGNIRNINITSNTFTGRRSAEGEFLSMGLGFSSSEQKLDLLTCSDNYFDTLALAVYLPTISNSIITGNFSRYTLYTIQTETISDAVSTNVEISDNQIMQGKGTAITIDNFGATEDLRIRNNIIDNINPNVNDAAIELKFWTIAENGSVLVEGNKINIFVDYTNLPNPIGGYTGVKIYGDHRNTALHGNEINYEGTDPYPIPPFNGYAYTPTGICIETSIDPNRLAPTIGEINITNNQIQGFKTSISFYNYLPPEGTPESGYYGWLAEGMVVNINNNSFTGDSMSINNGINSETVNANCNWYGSANEFDIVQRLSASTVNYTPWLTDAGDYDTELTGFQPLPGSCSSIVYPGSLYVNDNNTNGDRFTTAIGDDANNGTADSPLATINFAFSVAQPGDTIYVDAGNYSFIDDVLILNKSITILGTNYDVVPNDATDPFLPNISRNTEAEIQQGLIQTSANNILISGLKLTATESTPYSIYMDENEPGNEIAVTNNIFLLHEATQSIWLAGISGEEIISHGYLIANNRFEDATIENPGETGMGSIAIGNLKNIIISNNSFIGKLSVNGGHMMGGLIFTDNQQRIDSLICNMNYFDTLSTAIYFSFISNSSINNNVSRFTMNVLQFDVPQNLNLTNIEVSGNNFMQVKGTAMYVYNANVIENLVISNNEIEVTDPIYLNTAAIFLNFAQEAPNGLVHVEANKINISLNYPNPTEHAGTMMGVWLLGDHRNTNISNNEIVYSGEQIISSPVNNLPPMHTGILFSTGTNGSFPQPPSGEISITNNKFEGFKTSFATFNLFAEEGSTPEENYGGVLPGMIVNVNNNSFTGDSMSINNGINSEMLNANCNWYGGTDSEFISAKISTVTVDFEPWLVNGTDDDVTTGFQPVPGSCDNTPLVITVDLRTDVTCFTANNGNISISVTGGTMPYTYAWTKNPEPDIIATIDDITGIGPGTYSITVTDANNLTATLDIIITEPELLTLEIYGTDNGCHGESLGTAYVAASGGTEPYTYLWSNGQTTDAIADLPAGNYIVTVIDANGCTNNASYLVAEPAQLTVSIAGTSVLCYGGSNGTASVTVAGGTEPYTYLWNNGAPTEAISDVPAGIYSVIITDANGCTIEASYEVTEPAELIVNMTGTTASCNGSVSAIPEGGMEPYSYAWSNGATTPGITNVPAGTYTVLVSDANGCVVNGSYTVTGGSPINPTTIQIHVSCNGGSDGNITITGAGGTAPHTYNLNGSAFQPGNIFSNLAAGIYIVGVRDANGCSDFVTRTINQPLLLKVVLDSLRVPCGGASNGRIYITPSGGTGAKNYSWTGPNGFTSTVQDPNNVAAGNYTVTVTDAKGCTVSLTVELTERPVVIISEAISHVTCRGSFTGSINATVTGGSGLGFIYSWTGPTGFTATTEDVSGLKAGNYTINVTDIDNGCVVSKLIVITQPAVNLGLTTAKTNAAGCNSLGTITGNATGGTPPYMYSIDGINYQTSGLFAGFHAGSYTVWVKDANECTNSRTVTITDNGSDEYEGNNTKNLAKTISIGAIVNGRIALATDIADWFKFTTPAGTGNFILSLTHPSAVFTFNMYAAGTNTPALVPINTTVTSKEYVLSNNTTYYISITGGLSYTCYEMKVSEPASITTSNIGTSTENATIIEKTKLYVTEISNLTAKAYPNPHNGSFNLQIISPEAGIVKIELFSINGQKLQERAVGVIKGESKIVPLRVTQHGTIFYRVQIGKYIAKGKVIGLN